MRFAEACFSGGARVLQVRAKALPSGRLLTIVDGIVAAGARYHALVIVNDRPDIASMAGAGGVHLGQEDWVAVDRTKLAGMRIVGISTHSLAQAQQAERDGATYIGVGPVFPTGTKPNVKPVGLGLVKAVAGKVTVPFFAIGGITLTNLSQVRAAGATRVAVVSAILQAEDVAAAARTFKEKLK